MTPSARPCLPSLENALKTALANREFSLTYQPQIALDSGRLVGLQALLRCNSQALGLIGSERFIPLAETTGLIHPIGEWMLEQVCSQMAQWRDICPQGLTVAVKVSAAQFWQARFVATTAAMLRRHRLPAGKLMLELPSLATLATQGHTLAALQQIRALGALGVCLSMGDVEEVLDAREKSNLRNPGNPGNPSDLGGWAERCMGAAPSAGQPAMRINVLNIAASVVEGIGVDPEIERSCHRAIHQGRRRGLTVLAQGVETPEQARFLLKAGCHAAQGYRFSAPLQAHEIRHGLAGWCGASQTAFPAQGRNTTEGIALNTTAAVAMAAAPRAKR